MKRTSLYLAISIISILANIEVCSQDYKKDSTWKHTRKNIIRYNLSAPILFGFDKAVVFGYERLVTPNQSFSVNFGKAGLPKLLSIETDSFKILKDLKNTGFNASFDYRFYLRKENKFAAPHGLYIGPYYSLTQISRENNWTTQNIGGSPRNITTTMDIDINMLGAEMGYQFVFWERATLDLVLIGPGVGWYNVKAKFDGNISIEEREQLQDALQQILEQKFPGFNYVFSEKEMDAKGSINTFTVGFRYIIHIGFRF